MQGWSVLERPLTECEWAFFAWLQSWDVCVWKIKKALWGERFEKRTDVWRHCRKSQVPRNKGIVKVEDSEVTVKNTIPGQKVSFVINKKRKGKAEGRLLEILEKSELENAEANCPHYGVCGGCNYQTLPYEEQLKLKAGQVLELMKAVVPNAEDIFEGIRKSPQQFWLPK